jgi:methionyl aminopeptidase
MVEALEPGITTAELDRLGKGEIEKLGAMPAFLGLYGFPATACISVNEEIVHGIPGDRIVADGDLVSFDCGAIVDGMYSDHAVTVIAGTATVEKRALIDTTEQSLDLAIQAARPGNRVGDVSNAIESFVLPRGYELVREYTGHGIGTSLHEPPSVPNTGRPGQGPMLRPGMVIAIEPMVNAGGWQTELLEDQWTVVTADRKLSAHFEHTVAITDTSPEVLTVL